jgi:hypothetical protein
MRLCLAIWTLLSHAAESRRQAVNDLKASIHELDPDPAAGKEIVRASPLIMNFLGVIMDSSTLFSPSLMKYSVQVFANQ